MVFESLDNGKLIWELRDVDIFFVVCYFYYYVGWVYLIVKEFL